MRCLSLPSPLGRNKGPTHNGLSQVNSEVRRDSGVVELVPVAGRLFVLRRYGDRVRITQVERKNPPAPGSGTVVPFPARGR